MFLSRKFANMRSTKALSDYFALPESQPTPATLCWNKSHQGPSSHTASLHPNAHNHKSRTWAATSGGQRRGPPSDYLLPLPFPVLLHCHCHQYYSSVVCTGCLHCIYCICISWDLFLFSTAWIELYVIWALFKTVYCALRNCGVLLFVPLCNAVQCKVIALKFMSFGHFWVQQCIESCSAVVWSD